MGERVWRGWGFVAFPLRCAMHGAWQLRTPWGFLLVKRTTTAYAGLRPWYVYWSPNGTPWAATFAIGPGLDVRDRKMAPIRRAVFGWRGSADKSCVFNEAFGMAVAMLSREVDDGA